MKKAPSRGTGIALASGWLLLAGCSLLAPQRYPSRFFTLSPLPRAAQDEGRDPRGLTFGLGPIQLPAYLDRNEIATRVSATEITSSPAERWAEPLKSDVTRALSQNLSALLNTDRIVLYPWASSLNIDYQIQIDVLRFERTAGGESQLTAQWAIRDGHRGAYLVLKESHLTRPSSPASAAESVGALSANLGELSQEIATAVEQLPVPQPPTRKHP